MVKKLNMESLITTIVVLGRLGCNQEIRKKICNYVKNYVFVVECLYVNFTRSTGIFSTKSTFQI